MYMYIGDILCDNIIIYIKNYCIKKKNMMLNMFYNTFKFLTKKNFFINICGKKTNRK